MKIREEIKKIEEYWKKDSLGIGEYHMEDLIDLIDQTIKELVEEERIRFRCGACDSSPRISSLSHAQSCKVLSEILEKWEEMKK